MFKNLNFLFLCIGILITFMVSGIDFFQFQLGKDFYTCYWVKITKTSRVLHDDIGEFICNIDDKAYNGSVKCNIWEGDGKTITVATSVGNSYIRKCFLLTRTVCFMVFIDILISIKWLVEYFFGISLYDLGD